MSQETRRMTIVNKSLYPARYRFHRTATYVSKERSEISTETIADVQGTFA